jgi:hypothetical protein
MPADAQFYEPLMKFLGVELPQLAALIIVCCSPPGQGDEPPRAS